MERLLGKPDEVLQRKLRQHPLLIPMVQDLVRVVSRHDGNPFALTRLLCTPSLLPRLLSPPHSKLMSEALSYVVFGIQRIDNPAFTEDGIKVILALLRQKGGTRAVLEHEASLHMLETLAAASTYSPSAVASLELLALTQPGRLCLKSLGAWLSTEQATVDASRPRDASPGGHPEGEAHTAGTSGDGASAHASLKSSDVDASPSQGLQLQSLPSSSQQPASSPREAQGTSDGRSSGHWNLIAEAHAGRANSPWGISTALVSASMFMRSLRGIIAVGALNRRLSRANPPEELLGGWAADTHAREVPPTDLLEEMGRSASAALSITDAMETSSDSDGEASDHDEDVGHSEASPVSAANALEGESPGPSGSVAEQWETFSVRLRGGPTAAGLVGSRPSGVWQGRAEICDSVWSLDAHEPLSRIQDGPSSSMSATPATSVTTWLPTWPARYVQPDVVQAWVVLEIAGLEPTQEEILLARMTLAHKRVWLLHRLHREHHGSREDDEDPILFVECTREDTNGAIFRELRDQCTRNVGLGAKDLSGRLEVHFKDENSAGDAVKREWFSVVSDAFLDPERHLLVSADGGRSFRPRAMNPRQGLGGPHDEGRGAETAGAFATHASASSRAAVDVANSVTDGGAGASSEGCRREMLLRDYEMLGRFIGLALLQQVTIGVRLHPSVCRLLLNGGALYEYTHDDVLELDPMLLKHKVQYALENDVEMLCLDFTDIVEDVAASEVGHGAGEVMAAAERRVELKLGGAEIAVTQANKAEYVDLVCRWRLIGCIHEPVSCCSWPALWCQQQRLPIVY